MIAVIQGTVLSVEEKSITLLTTNIGFRINVPKPELYQQGESTTLYTHMHWNQEQGPLLVGFPTDFDKKVFLLIIECPKIGPSIALSIMAQIEASRFLELVASQNTKGLSQLHGIGAKKAEQIIIELKNKVIKLYASIPATANANNQQLQSLQEISDVLCSLNYSKQEINQAISFISNKKNDATPTFDQLLRSALSFLSNGASI